MKTNIILRTCDRVESVSNVKPRLKPKKDVIRVCYNSLQNNILRLMQSNKHAIRTFNIVDDHSSKETIVEVLETAVTKFNIVQPNGTGNGSSLEKCYEIADGLEEDSLIFFVEDDYLLQENCLEEMLYIHKHLLERGQDVVVHPVDYIDRYKVLNPAHIVLGKSVHWRTIGHTTGTFMISKKNFINHRDNYAKFTKYGIEPGVSEDNSINLTYKSTPCVSPIPSLGHHFQYEETLSPHLEWKELWAKNDY